MIRAAFPRTIHMPRAPWLFLSDSNLTKGIRGYSQMTSANATIHSNSLFIVIYLTYDCVIVLLSLTFV